MKDFSHINYPESPSPQSRLPPWNVTNETAWPALALTLVSCSWHSFYWSQAPSHMRRISPEIRLEINPIITFYIIIYNLQSPDMTCRYRNCPNIPGQRSIVIISTEIRQIPHWQHPPAVEISQNFKDPSSFPLIPHITCNSK